MGILVDRETTINILVTLNSNYVRQLVVLLISLLRSNPGTSFIVYVAHSSMTEQDFTFIHRHINTPKCSIVRIRIPDHLLSDAPVTRRYPKEMYYRIFAAQFLPRELDRILYLDPDIVVINSISALYDLDFQGYLFAAASHIYEPLEKLNRIRLNMPENSTYVNSGVLLLNLSLLRREQDMSEIFNYMRTYKNRLFLPDQDVLNGVYGKRILTVDPKIYNLSERYYFLHNLHPKHKDCKINLDWVHRNTAIIHYCGKNKPWHDNYKGELGVFYQRYAQSVLDHQSVAQELAK